MEQNSIESPQNLCAARLRRGSQTWRGCTQGGAPLPAPSCPLRVKPGKDGLTARAGRAALVLQQFFF